jgi:hypothetical protein
MRGPEEGLNASAHRMGKTAKKKAQPASGNAGKRYYFVSYSTGEPAVETFVEYLEVVFDDQYELKRTPSALASGESQHDTILDLIAKCEFGVVCLDGMRPNVVYEYGALRGNNKPVLLFRENSSTVDIGHFTGNVVGASQGRPPIDLDKQFSNSKDRFCTPWNHLRFKETLTEIWQAYDKMRKQNEGLVEVPRPKICT